MSNPVFSKKQKAPTFRGAPAIDAAGAMTYDDVIMKTLFCMGVLVAGGVIGWANPSLALVGVVVATVLAFVSIFKKTPSPTLVLGYAAFEGLALGGVSAVFEARYEGIVIQAVLATVSVFAATLAAFKFGGFRATPAMVKMVLVAMIGYLVYSVINLLLVAFHVANTPFGINSLKIPGTDIPIGVAIGLIVVLLAAFNLIMDFTTIEDDVTSHAPQIESWRNAFGLMLTMVWLYLEILRLLALLRGDD
ncbi:Bax inhibitor-1/YccA family protein [Paenarthrobacter sp. YJN-5]|uniref:Bax inhibitor-1/YccA family protein n=1 Tax=Paenarthrobacter sp. YJN-5 TaxID=2735316 RepID=UPI001877BFA4|nr:Bax inhibitor-1/YccA family protein [Paenarthrobacter sp. YJN-5]QOT19339.1 Bax inhibitor-1/YccA family protein [Paenarthrobacter sp. YJN-5]